MLSEFGLVLLFLLLGGAFVFVGLSVGSLFRPDRPTPVKTSPYECGEQVVGSPFIRFNSRFYVVALIFLIFDVEVLVLYPLATQFAKSASLGPLIFLEILFFVGVLVIGLLYVWCKGDLEWIKTARNP